MNKWHQRFMILTDQIRSWSKDPSTQVGALIVPPSRRQFACGYNGLPAGIKDDERLLDRDWKIKSVVHAEANALLMCPFPTEGCTMYVSPIMPCSSCAALIIQAGIETVVSWEDSEATVRWNSDHALAMFAEAGINILRIPRP